MDQAAQSVLDLKFSIQQWSKARRKVRSWIEQHPGPSGAAELSAVAQLRCEVYDCEWEVIQVLRNQPSLEWGDVGEEVMSSLSDHDKAAVVSLFADAQGLHVEVADMPLSKTWFIPFAFWDDGTFREEVPGDQDDAEADSVSVLEDFYDHVQSKLKDDLALEWRLRGAGYRLHLEFVHGLALDRLRHTGVPSGSSERWDDTIFTAFKEATRQQGHLKAGCIAVIATAESYSILASARDVLRQRLRSAAPQLSTWRSHFGALQEREEALVSSELARWGLWSAAAIHHPLSAGAQYRRTRMVVVRSGPEKQPLELQAIFEDVAADGKVQHAVTGRCLLGKEALLRDALEPWAGVSDPNHEWTVCQSESVASTLPSDWFTAQASGRTLN